MRSFPWQPALEVALLAAGIAAACETVPYTGRSQLQFMSPNQESQMGAQAYQRTLAKMKLSSDAAASEMVTRVGSRIAQGPLSPHGRGLAGVGTPPEFLSTHPSEPTRIQQIEVWMPEAMQSYRPR